MNPVEIKCPECGMQPWNPCDASEGRLLLHAARAEAVAARLVEERERLRKVLNTPEVLDFAKAVVLESAHQRERWGSEHDAGKTDADWFWLLGYLAGKALHSPGEGREKQLHLIITVAAAAANWHLAKLGKTNMRPGITPPSGESVA